jgi:hypothetical protein
LGPHYDGLICPHPVPLRLNRSGFPKLERKGAERMAVETTVHAAIYRPEL